MAFPPLGRNSKPQRSRAFPQAQRPASFPPPNLVPTLQSPRQTHHTHESQRQSLASQRPERHSQGVSSARSPHRSLHSLSSTIRIQSPQQGIIFYPDQSTRRLRRVFETGELGVFDVATLILGLRPSLLVGFDFLFVSFFPQDLE